MKINEIIVEGKDSDPCWDNYKQIGMKTKGGRKVPNCVPKEGVAEGTEEGFSIEDMVMDQWRNGSEVWQIASSMGMDEGEVHGIIDDSENGMTEGTNGEYDDEAGMAETNLHTIARAARGLLDTIDDHENLPEWVQEKIAKVEGMMVTAWDYLKSQEEQGVDPRQGVAEGTKETKPKKPMTWQQAYAHNDGESFDARQKRITQYEKSKGNTKPKHVDWGTHNKVNEQGVAEGSDSSGWIGNPAKWKEAVLQAHGPDVVFKNYSHPGQPGKRSVNAINAAGNQVGVYQRHNKMGMVQPNMQGVAEGAPIVVMPRLDRFGTKKPAQPYRNQGDIVPPTKPPSTEKRGVKGRPGQRPMPKYDESILEETYHDDDEFFEAYGVMEYNDEMINESEYQGRKVTLNKPMQGDVKKFKVYTKNAKGNVVKVNFGQKGAKIKKNNPGRRKNFRARHNCDNPGPKTGARYWSCRKW